MVIIKRGMTMKDIIRVIKKFPACHYDRSDCRGCGAISICNKYEITIKRIK